jgi:F0F1-type ATP synthase assembly protein I
MILPGLAGFWIDRRLGTVLVFLVVGLVVGCTFGIRHVIRLVNTLAKDD